MSKVSMERRFLGALRFEQPRNTAPVLSSDLVTNHRRRIKEKRRISSNCPKTIECVRRLVVGSLDMLDVWCELRQKS